MIKNFDKNFNNLDLLINAQYIASENASLNYSLRNTKTELSQQK